MLAVQNYEFGVTPREVTVNIIEGSGSRWAVLEHLICQTGPFVAFFSIAWVCFGPFRDFLVVRRVQSFLHLSRSQPFAPEWQTLAKTSRSEA